MNIKSSMQSQKPFINNIEIHEKQNIKKLSFGNCLTQDTLEIQGTQTKAKIYTKNIDAKAIEQIGDICSHPVLKDVPVRIMPDVHAGSGVPIGFTAPLNSGNEIIPSLISGDIGCGMLCCEIDIKADDIDFQKIDGIIHEKIIPNLKKMSDIKEANINPIKNELTDTCRYRLGISEESAIKALGTLGGGNHFIEIDKSEQGKVYMIIHTGSRGFGQAVYNHYQNIAISQNPYHIKKLSYLSGDEAKQYLDDIKFAQEYAKINRRIIADEIIKNMGWHEVSSFESIHNYVDKNNVIRKGAISANKGETLIIPLNMRDGAIIGIGKGNKDWNFSAPHGSGRKMTRTQARQEINLEQYKKSMDGIYSTSVGLETIDESPQSYKDSAEIKSLVEPTLDIISSIKPIYNYKNKK